LYDGYALSGPANASILLTELTNFRFKSDETPSEVVLRLQDIFDELESVPGNAAMVLNDTQKINYLLSAMRPERSLASVYSLIQAKQVRGNITFEKACNDLRFRCEALRADDLLHASHQSSKVRGLIAVGTIEGVPVSVPDAIVTPALITTAAQRQNKGATRKKDLAKKDLTPCLVKGCDTVTPPHMRLCKGYYHACIAGKTPSLPLKSGGAATYNSTTHRIVYPSSDAAPAKGPRTVVKAAVTFVPGTNTDE
jgi:hypothetical protein